MFRKVFNLNPLDRWLDNPPRHLSQQHHWHQPEIIASRRSKRERPYVTDLCCAPGSAILRAAMCAARKGLVLERKGEDAGLVQGRDAN